MPTLNSNPFHNPLVAATCLTIGDYVLGGGSDTKAKLKGRTFHANLPYGVLQVERINNKSIAMKDIETGKTYTMSKTTWSGVDVVKVRTIPAADICLA